MLQAYCFLPFFRSAEEQASLPSFNRVFGAFRLVIQSHGTLCPFIAAFSLNQMSSMETN